MYTYIQTRNERFTIEGGVKGGGKETTLQHQALQTRDIIFYSDAAHVFAFFFFFLVPTCSSTLPQLPTMFTPHAAGGHTARVYNILCVQCVHSIIRSFGYHIYMHYYTRCIYIYYNMYMYIRPPLKRFLDCFFAQHKFRPKTKRQTAHGRRAENKQENIIMTGPTRPLAQANIPFSGLVTTCDALT